jgi:AraC-like DNA-binding protein
MKSSGQTTNGSRRLKYLIANEQDQQWGISVVTVGTSAIPGNYASYPLLSGHPSKYRFNTQKGRIFDEYQLVYIAEGKGRLYVSGDSCVEVAAGDAFLLRPSVWHNYFPDKKRGWVEYWIGFKGFVIDYRFAHGFFPDEKPLYKVGVRPEFVNYFTEAIEIAQKEETNYQQYLAGIVNHLLGLTLYYDSKRSFLPRQVHDIDKARTLIRDNVYEAVSPRQIADTLSMSYTWFRKIFKKYTGMSPGKYIRNVKMEAAKDLLIYTDYPVKEIAFRLKFEDVSHFIGAFKAVMGSTPVQYRKINHNGK